MTTTIATYYWQPDPGSKFCAPYTSDDVRRLRDMVARNLTVPHEFAVITDRPEAFQHDATIRAIPIDRATHVPGTCFVRLMSFHPEGQSIFGDRLIQIDLDTIIVGNMDHLLERDEDLILWSNPTRHPKRPGRAIYNTSFLSHRPGSLADIWKVFTGLNEAQRRGWKDDQWLLSELFGETCPTFNGARDGIYRIARKDTPGSGVDGELPDNACIVFFTGSNGKWANPEIRAANPWIEGFLA